MNPSVDKFVKNAKQWREEIAELRSIVLSTKLQEELKWGKPCYCHEGKNIAIIQPFKSCLGMMFFKGSLLKDPKGVLVDNGPNSQAARRLEFGSVQEITKSASFIKAYIKEAVELETAGKTVEFVKNPEPVPDELTALFGEHKGLEAAFKSLTPGRQRGYILHFAGAKQTSTRRSRIEKCIPAIMEGRGLNDR